MTFEIRELDESEMSLECRQMHAVLVFLARITPSRDAYFTPYFQKRIDQMMGDGYRFVTVGPVGGQAELALGPAHVFGMEPGKGISAGRGMEGASGISFAVDDVAGTYATLVERGVQFSGPPEDMPWGDKATWLIDPDGNRYFFTGR